MTTRHLPLPGLDLQQSLETAASELAALPPGTVQTWHLPGGRHDLPPLVLDVGAARLHLAGRPSTRLVFAGGGLSVLGAALHLSELRIEATAPGPLTALELVAGERIELASVKVRQAAGSQVVGILLQAPEVGAAGTAVGQVDASGGDAVGLRVDAQRAVLVDTWTSEVRATGAATGLELVASEAAELSASTARKVEGTRAVGLAARVGGAEGHLQVVDATVGEISTAAGQGDAVGLWLSAGGQLTGRGLSADRVRGARATGILALSGAELDLLAGNVQRIIGRTHGAAGVRALAGPSPRPISLRDLAIEGVGGEVVGTGPAPSPSWQAWARAAAQALIAGAPPPGLPGAGTEDHHEEVVGLHVAAPVSELEPWFGDQDAGPVYVEQCQLRRVAGAGLAVTTGLRDVEVQGVELWTLLRGGWIDGEVVLVAQLSLHRAQAGLVLGPCDASIYDSLLTGVVSGDGLVLHEECELQVAAATWVEVGAWPLMPLATLPYRDPGPAGIPATMRAGRVPPGVPVDLRLRADAGLHEQAVEVPGQPERFVGAHPPEGARPCDLRDPLVQPDPPPPWRLPESPVVDYLARDARSLLAVMMDRARTSLPSWTTRGPADLTTMVLETLAHELDLAAYRQERAVAEGYLDTALLRRSVEDHARLLDYVADPGLSATTMVEFRLHEADIQVIAARRAAAEGSPPPAPEDALELLVGSDRALVIPTGTVLANATTAEASVLFTTEADLEWRPELATLRLAQDVPAGATQATLQGDLRDLPEDRWLVLRPGGELAPHVVRVTRVQTSTDTTVVHWDPRRPAPAPLPAEGEQATVVLGNVVPAHHGIPLLPLRPDEAEEDPLRPFRELLEQPFDATDDSAREVTLPLDGLSCWALGWPLPGQPPRPGKPQLTVEVDGVPWTRVEDLSLAGPQDQVYVLRAAERGGAVLRFGDGACGARLPRRPVVLRFGLAVGRGEVGNVGAHRLTRVLLFGDAGATDFLDQVLGTALADRDELVRRLVRVDNPLPATGGREPEPLDRIRYHASRTVREARTAIVPADYERLLAELPEVQAARARVIDLGIRRVLRCTVLLHDEDTLDPDERLRRWALVRRRLEEIRLLGFDVELVPPIWVPLDLDLSVDVGPTTSAETVRRAVLAALGGDGGLLDPDRSGLGGDVHLDALYRAVLDVPGVLGARVRRLRRLAPGAREHLDQGVLPVGAEEVAVVRPPYGHGPDGVVTVTVCGGRL